MKKYLIILDVDGTLVKDGFRVHEKNKEVLKKLHKMGHTIMLATGRHYSFSKSILDDLDISSPIIHTNGSLIYSEGLKFKQNFVYIAKDKFRELIKEDVFNKDDYVGHLHYLEDKFLSSTGKLSHVIEEIESSHVIPFPTEINDMWSDPIQENILKTTIIIRKKDQDFEKIVRELNNKYKDYMKFYLWPITNEFIEIEILPKGVSKWNKIKEVVTTLKIDPDNVIAMGDGFNDIEMIKNVKLGVAMKNSVEPLKDIADVITEKTNEEGGVGFFLEKHFDLKGE